MTPTSFVLVQYTESRTRLSRPTSVVATRAGGFTVTGQPGARFRFDVR